MVEPGPDVQTKFVGARSSVSPRCCFLGETNLDRFLGSGVELEQDSSLDKGKGVLFRQWDTIGV